MKKPGNYLIFIASLIAWPGLHAASYDSTIEFANKVTLSIPVSGQIKVASVSAGQRVQAGEIMIALDKTPYEAAAAQAQAEVTSNTTLEKEAARDLEQAQELYDRGVLSTVELENAENQHIRAKAALQSAEARLTKAQYDLAHSQIIAPANGWVLKVQARANETINSQFIVQPLVVFAEANKYIVSINVPLQILRSLKVGQDAKVNVGKSRYKGVVTSIAYEPLSGGKDMYPVEVEFDSKDTLLQAGQNAKVDI